MNNRIIKVAVTETKQVKVESYGVYDLNIEQGSLATTTYEYNLWLSTVVNIRNKALVMELSDVLNTVSKLANMPEVWVDLSEHLNKFDKNKTRQVISILNHHLRGYSFVEDTDITGLQLVSLPKIIIVNVYSSYSGDCVPLADTGSINEPVSVRYEIKQINHLTLSNPSVDTSKLYDIFKSTGLTENIIESTVIAHTMDLEQHAKACHILHSKRPAEYRSQLTAQVVERLAAEDPDNIYILSEKPQTYKAVLIPRKSPSLLRCLLGSKHIPEHVELRLFRSLDLKE